jgi:hypothetical protein
MNCNCNNKNNALTPPKVRLVQGNLLRLALPLTLRTVDVVDGKVEVNDEPFYPSGDYPVKVILSKGANKATYDATMQGNIAYIEDKGKLPVGTYEITVTCSDNNGNPYRFNEIGVVQVFHSTADAGITSPIEYEVQTWYLDAAIYLALKGEDGVGIEDIETTSSSEIGGMNTVTFILTDGRTKTFTVMNGSGSVDQLLDENSKHPIANKVVTARFNELADELAGLFGDVDYDTQNKSIRFWDKGKTNVLASLDARPFIKDGMVNSVYISNNTLVITFNTDSGREAIGVPLSSVFNPNNYYTKTQVDNRIASVLSGYYTKSQVDNLFANIDLTGYAEIDQITGKLKYGDLPTIVLDTIDLTGDGVDTGSGDIIYGSYNGHINKATEDGTEIIEYDLDAHKHIVFLNSEDDCFYRWTGTKWQQVGGSGDGSGGYQVSFSDGNVIFTGNNQPVFDNGNVIL